MVWYILAVIIGCIDIYFHFREEDKKIIIRKCAILVFGWMLITNLIGTQTIKNSTVITNGTTYFCDMRNALFQDNETKEYFRIVYNDWNLVSVFERVQVKDSDAQLCIKYNTYPDGGGRVYSPEEKEEMKEATSDAFWEIFWNVLLD